MPKTRRQFAGAGVASSLTGAIAASGVTTFSISASTNWSTSTTIPFYVVLSPQTASEEKMLVTLSSNTLTIVSRGVDGTTASSHASGATIYPVFTATDANEANELTSKYANRGSIVYQGTSTFEELVKGTQGHPLVIGANDPAWGQVGTVGIADDAITSAKIAPGAIVDADINASAAIALSKLATGALPTEITVASANIVNGTIVEADLADSAVTSAKIADGTIVAGDIASAAITNAKLNNGASGDIPLVTVSTSAATGGKNGDVWIVV
jgi:hypothetical protein